MDNNFDELMDIICPLDILRNSTNDIEIVIEPFDTNEGRDMQLQYTLGWSKVETQLFGVSYSMSHHPRTTIVKIF